MKLYLTYEIVSISMIFIIGVFNIYRNLIMLYKNKIYNYLLLATGGGLAVTVFGYSGIYFHLLPENRDNVIKSIMLIFFSINFYLVYLYDISLVGQMRKCKRITNKLFFCILAAGTVFAILKPQIAGYPFQMPGTEQYIGKGDSLYFILLAICILAGLWNVISKRELLNKSEIGICIFTNILLFIDLWAQVFVHIKKPYSLYVMTFCIVMDYLVVYNSHRYRYAESGCMGRDGLTQVIEEKEYYEKNFSILGISINNIESITNYCSESEINQIHDYLGKVFRKCHSRHDVYQTHSFEYVLMFQSGDNVRKKHMELIEEIPRYIRINMKNIAISCSFYSVEFADAKYSATDMDRIMTSLRKKAREEADRKVLLCYDGENKLEIQQDLETLSIINDCVAKNEFNIEYIPIATAEDMKTKRYELVATERTENGHLITQEKIWNLAKEVGIERETGFALCESVSRYVKEKRLLEQGLESVHINVSTKVLTGMPVLKEYLNVFRKYNIPGECMSLEITMEEGADEEELEHCIQYMKEYGITVILDQFGVSAFNMKNTLNMSFDAVKINHYIVRKYCQGESSQLIYMIDMLRKQNWVIIADGIDEPEYVDKMKKYKVEYLEGTVVSNKEKMDQKTERKDVL